MPVTILDPLPGKPFGPGFVIEAIDDTIGPLPVDWGWEVIFTFGDPTDEESIETNFSLDTFNQHQLRGTFLPTVGVTQQPRSSMFSSTARVDVRLKSSPSTIVSQGQVTVVPDFQTGVLYQIGTKATTGGGLTTEQAEQLQVTYMTVVPWFFWELAGEILPELLDAIGGRIRTKPTRIQFDGPLSGLVDIPPPTTGVFTKWVGIEWAVVGAPPGLGLDFGSPDSTEINWGQISRRRAVADGTETIDDTWYESRTTASQYWGMEEPSSVQVYILPGVLTQFWYLVQLEPIADPATSSPITGDAGIE
jgi:hypothetical protein